MKFYGPSGVSPGAVLSSVEVYSVDVTEATDSPVTLIEDPPNGCVVEKVRVTNREQVNSAPYPNIEVGTALTPSLFFSIDDTDASPWAAVFEVCDSDALGTSPVIVTVTPNGNQVDATVELFIRKVTEV